MGRPDTTWVGQLHPRRFKRLVKGDARDHCETDPRTVSLIQPKIIALR